MPAGINDVLFCFSPVSGTKPLHCFNVHHWLVNSVQRSPFFRDIILSTGGWNFAIWKEGVMVTTRISVKCDQNTHSWLLTPPTHCTPRTTGRAPHLLTQLWAGLYCWMLVPIPTCCLLHREGRRQHWCVGSVGEDQWAVTGVRPRHQRQNYLHQTLEHRPWVYDVSKEFNNGNSSEDMVLFLFCCFYGHRKFIPGKISSNTTHKSFKSFANVLNYRLIGHQHSELPVLTTVAGSFIITTSVMRSWSSFTRFICSNSQAAFTGSDWWRWGGSCFWNTKESLCAVQEWGETDFFLVFFSAFNYKNLKSTFNAVHTQSNCQTQEHNIKWKLMQLFIVHDLMCCMWVRNYWC